MDIDLTSPPLPESLTLSAGIDWVSECAGEVRAKADVDFALASMLDGEVARLDGEAAANAPLIRALVSALIERMEDRSTIALMSQGLAQLRGRARRAAAATA
jgi:hypothetical protein